MPRIVCDMRAPDDLIRLAVIGAVFVVLGAIGWVWFEPAEFGQGASTGGVLVVLVAVALIMRRRSAG